MRTTADRQHDSPQSQLRIEDMTIDIKIQIPSLNRSVSAIRELSVDNSNATWIVLAHGAGADMRHAHMNSLAEMLLELGLNVLRFNFPYREDGKTRVDNQPTCMATIAAAISLIDHGKSNIILAGHSFGGRMMTHFCAEQNINSAKGLILFSFPLHPAGKPGIKRAEHLPVIKIPMLFLSGDRDGLAEPQLMAQTCSQLKSADLHWLQTADHGYKILKRTRTLNKTVYQEAAEFIQPWIASVL